ncbi:(Fe-S)-binding protein [Thermopolyspora sp. NPDC052614]|uniref:(Fe-S)-binding protein n=1 Tax=Thermopolyspora sp. NPDC052614 TaxID=3155682 RepID=UPI0034311F47
MIDHSAFDGPSAAAPECAEPGGRSIFDPQLLDRCISCGFCLPVCPTYKLTGQETSSPRGRITLMRALETGRLEPDDPTLAEEASFCLGCRACETVCPAGVQYGELLEQWRDHQWAGRRRPLIARLLMAVVSRTGLLKLQGLVRRYAKVRRAEPRPGVPDDATPRPAGETPSLMLGCVERGLYPQVSQAVLRLRPELAVPPNQGCCGALHAHNGDSAAGRELALKLGERLPGTIVTTAGGCAAHLAHHLGRDRVAELSDYLDRTGHRPSGEVRIGGRRARVTLQDSCHLRNGLGVTRPPRELIAAVADYVELPGAADCCGAAGTYSLLRPADSRAVLAPKTAAIEAANVDYIVALNPGCLRQLRQGLRRARSTVKAIHLAELLAMAANTTDDKKGNTTANSTRP